MSRGWPAMKAWFRSRGLRASTPTFLAGLAQHGLNHKFDLQAQGALALGASAALELAHRVHTILRARPTLSPIAARGLLAAVTCGLVIGAFELAQCPQLVAFVPATSIELAGHPATKVFTSRSAHTYRHCPGIKLGSQGDHACGGPEMMHAGPLPPRRAVSSHLSKMPAARCRPARMLSPPISWIAESMKRPCRRRKICRRPATSSTHRSSR